jgi:carbonic anhydrase/acetyltransferase-like protein (isoleucine patch superfamily)
VAQWFEPSNNERIYRMAIYRIGDRSPIIATSAYVADSAQVIGTVELSDDVSVWFGVVIRGDNDWIRIGAGSNIQENSVLHTDSGIEMVLGTRVTVGHMAMLHGCTVGDGSLIGIGAVILNGAKIGRQCVIGAGAIVTEGKEIPDRSLVLGAPGKVVRTLSDDDVARFARNAPYYIERGKLYREQLVRLDTTPATGPQS